MRKCRDEPMFMQNKLFLKIQMIQQIGRGDITIQRVINTVLRI